MVQLERLEKFAEDFVVHAEIGDLECHDEAGVEHLDVVGIEQRVSEIVSAEEGTAIHLHERGDLLALEILLITAATFSLTILNSSDA